MLIEKNSEYYLKRTRAFAKEVEFGIPENLRAPKDIDVDDLFPLVIACIADLSADIVRGKVNDVQIKEHAKELYFTSKFFDSYLYINGTSKASNDNYLNLVGAIAYYLCDQIGSSLVLIRKIDKNTLDLSNRKIDILLYHLLINDSIIPDSAETNPTNDKYFSEFIRQYNILMSCGIKLDQTFITRFRMHIYKTHDFRDIFLIDALLAIFILKVKYSIFEMLPNSSYIPLELLIDIVSGNHFVREMWPAQRSMCDMGLFKGVSGVIQMPTGAGKTKSVSMAIFSAFCSGNVQLSVVIAPFRALCREISNDLKADLSFDSNIQISEISDLLQMDYVLEDLFNPKLKTVVVTTPEKFLYITRQDERIIDDIGQIIFDEGHLFDDEARGATYELLITSILKKLTSQAQRILISAIIPNVSEINNWFTKGEGVAINGHDIAAVEKLPAALRWELHGGDRYCYLYYINKDDFQSYDFFVPRLIEVSRLQSGKNEKQRYFPSVDFSSGRMLGTNDMAIACLLRIVPNDNVAIFCGRKDSANKILTRIIELRERGFDVSGLLKRTDVAEQTRIINLICKNFGHNSLLYYAAQLGLFAHHASIPDGIKIAVEFALKESMITNVVCTSTLAQGVNLPIKYLIVSSIYQAGEQIKVRDFHNLIGRTARSGMFTEGTVIFSDPFAYNVNQWRWEQYRKLLDSSNSEMCKSVILDIVKSYPINNEPDCCLYTYALLRYEDFGRFLEVKKEFLEKYPPNSELRSIFYHIFHVLSNLESYIALSIANNNNEYSESFVDELLSNTLAETLATEEEKEALTKLLFKMCEYLVTVIPEENTKRSFARSMISCEAYLELQNEIRITNFNELTEDGLLPWVIEMILKYASTRTLHKLVSMNEATTIAKMWINGDAYFIIHSIADIVSIKIIRRNQEKTISIEEIESICNSDFGYSSSIVINGICEILQANESEGSLSTTIENLQDLSQKLKYGLPDKTAIYIYELGFNDRFLAQEIRKIIGIQSKKKDAKKEIIKHFAEISNLLENYPSVFQFRLKSL